jgi:membrane-bound acyltransferase YfiQ involved in biofilm formation
MVTAQATPGASERPLERRFPPIVPFAVVSMALVIVGVIYLAAYLPREAPLGPAIGLLVAAGLLFLANVVMVARLQHFAWDRFRVVCEWTLLAYAVIAGMLEYVFVLDGTRGSMLVVMSLMLLVFTVNIPLLLAFAVARFKEPGAAE